MSVASSPDSPNSLAFFLPAVREWFETELGPPTLSQELAWPVIAAGDHCLVTAPTGSGKTLAAFLFAVDRLFRDLLEGRSRDGVDLVYVSPLKALATDIERNLSRPLREIVAMDARLAGVTVGVRSGDTSASDRQKMIRKPPNILITTPESLYLLLTAKKARPGLGSVRAVILDEVHALYGTKRGVHLSLSLERLSALTKAAEREDPQRIGLSATVRPLADAARFLGGPHRCVSVVDASSPPALDLSVVGAGVASAGNGEAPDGETSWDRIASRLRTEITSRRSTLVFVNTRATAERLVARLNETVPDEVVPDEVAPRGEGAKQEADGGEPDEATTGLIAEGPGGELARAHHGSVSRETREHLERSLRTGRLPALVATGTLELGIDIGGIDLVCQVGSTKSVSRALQRVGRSGHLVNAVSQGRFYPLYRSELPEIAALVREMQAGRIEETLPVRNCLDVLAQHIVAEVSARDWAVDQLYMLVRESDAYVDLSRQSFEAVLSMLSGGRGDADLTVARPRISWDRTREAGGVLCARPGAGRLAAVSGGVIPDRGLYPVVLASTGVRLGELDEEFVFESKPGDVFALGSSFWRVLEIGRDRVQVTEAAGAVPRLPFWRGEGMGRPRSLGLATGRLLREMEQVLSDPGSATGPAMGSAPGQTHGEKTGSEELADRLLLRFLREECACDEVAAQTLLGLVREQSRQTPLPTDRRVVLETFRDEIGDTRVVIHSVFGARVNQALGIGLQARVGERLGLTVEMSHSDNGVMFRFPDLEGPPPEQLLRLVTSHDIDDLVLKELAGSALFASRFRENAQRALLLPRNRPGQRTPLWLQRLRAADLMVLAVRDPDFPLVLETYRECLEDALDMRGLRVLLEGIEQGTIAVATVATDSPSAFASDMLWRFVFGAIYNEDAPRAEVRAAAVSVNRDILADLLGTDNLAELLDPGAVAEVTARVSRTAPAWAAVDDESLLDLLQQLGDLSLTELDERSAVDVPAALERLGARVVEVAGRYVASEEAAEYRAVLSGTGDLEGWLRRHVLGRGIFLERELEERYNQTEAVVLEVLTRLVDCGLLTRGAFTPEGGGKEWVGTDTLRRMHRRTLAVLRRRTAPVDATAFARWLREHHHLGDPAFCAPAPSGQEGLSAVLSLLEGVPLYRERLETDLLPARLPDYRPEMLDALLLSGQWMWVALDTQRVVFVRPFLFHLLRLPSGPGVSKVAGDAEPDLSLDQDLPLTVLRHLSKGGGWRVSELAGLLRLEEGKVRGALRALLWSGQATNDTFGPGRSPVVRATGRVSPASPASGGVVSRRSATGRLAARQRVRRRRTGAGVGHLAEKSEGRWSALARATVQNTAQDVFSSSDVDLLLQLLLGRYGLVAKEMPAAESWVVSWSMMRPALDRAEAVGDLRRGYFVEGLSGIQFALPWVVEELRRPVDPERDGCWVLPAVDPANPWGVLLESRGVRRRRGSLLVLECGAPVVAVEGGRVTPLSDRPASGYEPAFLALRRAFTARGQRRRQLEEWGKTPLHDPELLRVFAAAGWTRTAKGVGLP